MLDVRIDGTTFNGSYAPIVIISIYKLKDC